MICVPREVFLGDKIKKNSIGWACSACGDRIGTCRGDVMGRNNLKGGNGRMILKLIFKHLDGGKYWSVLAQDRDRWRDLVNAVMNLRLFMQCREFL